MEAAERPFYIYMHTAPNGKRYVGQTCQHPEQRWRNGLGYKGCIYLDRAIKKYGWESFDHQILCVVHYQKVANLFERHYIAKFNSANKLYGYNMTDGGSAGYVYNDETRALISRKAKERGIPREQLERMAEGRRKSGYRPKPWTEEQKRAQSERMRGPNHPNYGKKLPRDRVEKSAAAHRGRKASDETRRRQSVVLRNSEKIQAKKKAVLQFDLDGNFIAKFAGMVDAARSVGGSREALHAVCKGRTDSAYGYVWEYEDATLRAEANEVRAKRRNASTIGLPVVQLDLCGEEIARYRSTVDASKQTGFPRYAITNCCRGRSRTSHGYIWRYITEVDMALQQAS